MVETCNALSSRIVDFVDADFLVPRRHSKVVGFRRERQIRDAVFRGVKQGNVVLEFAQSIRSGTGSGGGVAKQASHLEYLRLWSCEENTSSIVPPSPVSLVPFER